MTGLVRLVSDQCTTGCGNHFFSHVCALRELAISNFGDMTFTEGVCPGVGVKHLSGSGYVIESARCYSDVLKILYTLK